MSFTSSYTGSIDRFSLANVIVVDDTQMQAAQTICDGLRDLYLTISASGGTASSAQYNSWNNSSSLASNHIGAAVTMQPFSGSLVSIPCCASIYQYSNFSAFGTGITTYPKVITGSLTDVPNTGSNVNSGPLSGLTSSYTGSKDRLTIAPGGMLYNLSNLQSAQTLADFIRGMRQSIINRDGIITFDERNIWNSAADQLAQNLVDGISLTIGIGSPYFKLIKQQVFGYYSAEAFFVQVNQLTGSMNVWPTASAW